MAEIVDGRVGHRLGDAIQKAINARHIDLGDSRQIHRVDGLACGAFNGSQHAAFARGNEQDGIALTTGTTGTANAVDIAFRIVRNVVVQHVGDAFHVETAGGHVGGNQHINLAVLELLDSAFALSLLHVTVDGGSGDTTSGELFSQLFGHLLGTGKDDHGVERFGFDDAGDGIELVHAADNPVTLTHVFGRDGLGLNRDFDRIFQIGLGNAANCGRHGG